jgi:hypothetical protein
MQEHGVSLYKEVSAKTGNQVGEAFKILGEKLMTKVRNKAQDQGKVSLNQSKMSHPDSPEGEIKKKKCCN